jgi:ribosomal protein L16 Arg81 hydroxylase
MIDGLLSNIWSEDFLTRYFGRVPLAQPKTARTAIPFFSWDTLEGLLDAPSGLEILYVRSGQLLPDIEARTFAEFERHLRDGCSIVVRKAELHDPGLRMIANGFEAQGQGDVTIHLFVTPAEHHGFGWHYDCEDVFILQTAGSKEYFLRENSVNPRPRIDAIPADMQYERETSTRMMSCTLLPGDWLYLPRGWWHMAKGNEDSLSISIGVLTPDAQRAAKRA